jgi:UDP-N-acetylmuramyl pentapeptide phosphotransferase/UDP-N-acetylglucosamine-1-phosphate transferase
MIVEIIGDTLMTIQIIGALLAAFCITKVFGKRLIPWLEKHGIRQPIKDEVEQKIYSKKNDSTDCG